MRKRPTRTSLALWPAFLVALAAICAVSDAAAQTPYVPYYGKNLVRYDRFDWQIYKTEHFEGLETKKIWLGPQAQEVVDHVGRPAQQLAFLIPLHHRDRGFRGYPGNLPPNELVHHHIPYYQDAAAGKHLQGLQ